jgi:hypothetical protein
MCIPPLAPPWEPMLNRKEKKLHAQFIQRNQAQTLSDTNSFYIVSSNHTKMALQGNLQSYHIVEAYLPWRFIKQMDKLALVVINASNFRPDIRQFQAL